MHGKHYLQVFFNNAKPSNKHMNTNFTLTIHFNGSSPYSLFKIYKNNDDISVNQPTVCFLIKHYITQPSVHYNQTWKLLWVSQKSIAF